MAGTHLLEPRHRPAKPVPEVRRQPARSERRPSYVAFQVLRAGFAALPNIAGVDKFFHLLANWDMYLANRVEKLLPVSGHTFMLIAGVIEILAGVLVAVLPRIGAFVVAGWLAGIIVNILLIPGFYDVAFRDFGLAVGAVGLGFLAREYTRPLKKRT